MVGEKYRVYYAIEYPSKTEVKSFQDGSATSSDVWSGDGGFVEKAGGGT